MNALINLIICTIYLSSFSLQAEASADFSSTKVKVTDLSAQSAGLDEEIQNDKMLTKSGSQSKYSMSVVTGYSGGSLKDPASKDKKNLFGGDIREEVGAFLDSSLRYRFNKNSSLTSGIGLFVVQPFHEEKKGQDYNDKIELTNPYINYSYFAGRGSWMYSASASVTIYTRSIYTDEGYRFKPIVSGSLLYNFKSPFQLGISLDSGYNFFKSGISKNEFLYDFTFGWHPFVEYQVTDSVSLRTNWDFGLSHSVFNNSDGGHWDNNLVSQSMGLGISVNRDIYLYPNILVSAQDFYSDASFDNSTVAISAILNLF